jgi:hypothetical protein
VQPNDAKSGVQDPNSASSFLQLPKSSTHSKSLGGGMQLIGVVRDVTILSIFSGQGTICRTLCSDSNDSNNIKKTNLNLAKPKDRWQEKQEKKLEAERAKEIG